jgi:hypothetical protein
LGIGLGQGKMKHIFAADSDMVFATLSEEWGLIMALMCVISIVILALFAMRCAPVSRSSMYAIASCTAAGILLVQTIFNALGTVDILPLTGVNFPFVSNGGSGMMGVAFVGYVFDLADGADTAAYMNMLNFNKEPRWNGCTIADMTVIDAIGNTVFMVMCPIPAPYAISGIPEIKAPETVSGSLEEKVWNKYVEVLTENYELSAAEVCALLAAELGTDAEVVDYGYDGVPADNFQFEIYDYMSAASFNADDNKVVYVINNYDGLDMMSWADYYFVMGGKYETVFGSFNASIIAIVDTSAPIAE